MPDTESQSITSWRRAALGILALAAILLFARLGARALWASEFRWAEIAREMRLSGNYFWPTIDGRVYYDKPLGTYWLVIGATHLTGAMNETAARIPSAVAGIISVFLMMMLARRLFDDWRTSILSGFILATSYSFVFFSRHASADVETIAGELFALYLFIRNESRPDGWWVFGLWTVMAATSLTKGLLGFVLPLLIIGSYGILADGWAELVARLSRGPLGVRIRWFAERSRWFFNWKTIPAAAIAGLIYALPFIVSREMMNSNRGLYLVYRENVLRYFEPFDHRGPIYLYVFVIFLLMAPWSVLLPAALARMHGMLGADRGSEAARHNRFVMVYFWATFLFFTLSGSRRSYYLLPILPAGAMMVAQLLTSTPESLTRFANALMRAGYLILAAIALIAILFVMPPSMILPMPLAHLPPAPARILFAGCWLISAIGVVYALVGLNPRRIAISLGILAYLTMFYIYIVAMPATEAYRPEKQFAAVVAEKLGPDFNGLGFYRNLETFFYLNPPHPIRQYENRWALHKGIADGTVRWLIIKQREAEELKLGGKVVAREAVYPWEDEKQQSGRVMLLKVEPSDAGA